MYIPYNANPAGIDTNDCTIRAISTLLDQSWRETYDDIVYLGRISYNMPSSDHVWGEYMFVNGFRRHIVPDTCPMCYSVKGFCRDNPYGKFLLKTPSHVVAVIDGNYYDTWDSGNEVPIYYWRKER